MNIIKLAFRVITGAYPDLTAQAMERLAKINQLTDQKKALKIENFRTFFFQKNTIAASYFNGVLFLYVLELPAPTGGKGEGIPEGFYPVQITYSPKFARLMPIVQNVPGRDGIRWHSGATWKSTLGCLIPGFVFSETRIKESTTAYDFAFNAIDYAQDKGYPISLNVVNFRQKAWAITGAFALVALLIIGLLAKFAFKKR